MKARLKGLHGVHNPVSKNPYRNSSKDNISMEQYFLSFFFCLSVVFKVKFVFCFLQVSHYTFAMCSYHEKQAEPTEMMELDGYTVDYCEAATGREI